MIEQCNNPKCDERFDSDNCPACGWIHPAKLRQAMQEMADPAHQQMIMEETSKLEAMLEHGEDGLVRCPYCGEWHEGLLVKHTAAGPQFMCLNDDCPSHGRQQ